MPASHDTTWSLFLAQRLSDLQLSAIELCRESGLHPSVVSRWLSGQTVPSISHLRLASPALQASLLELLVAAGHLTDDEVLAPRRQGVVAAINAEPDLRPEYRRLLAHTYRALSAID